MSERLNLDDVEARIERHRCHSTAPRTGDRDFLDLSRLIDHDAPALVAEIKRLREERARAYSALSEYGQSAVDISGDLEDGINAEHLMAPAERGEGE